MLVTFGTVEGGSQGSQSGTPEASTITSGSTFAPLGAGGTIYVGEMVQEQEVNLDQEFIVTGSATSGIYNLPITLRYQKTDGTPVQNSLSASIVIIAPPVLQISLRSPVPESVNVGEPFSLEVVIANNGKNTFNVTRITVEAENGELLDGQETLPKPIKTTENTSVMPMIMAVEEGKVEVTLTIYYLDDFNREATVVQTYETEAMAPPPPEDFPDMMPEFTPTPEPEDDGTIGKVLLGLLGLGS
jgi:hypothetical protein